MAYPSYLSSQNIPTNADTEGNWKALYANSAGDIKVRMKGGMDEVFTVAASQLLPVGCNKVYNSGTTVTNGNLTGLN